MIAITIKTRWPLRQIGENTIVLEIPEHDSGMPILSGEFIRAHQLSDRDVENAEQAALKSIAILP